VRGGSPGRDILRRFIVGFAGAGGSCIVMMQAGEEEGLRGGGGEVECLRGERNV